MSDWLCSSYPWDGSSFGLPSSVVDGWLGSLGGGSGIIQSGYYNLDLVSQSQRFLSHVSINQQYLNEPLLSIPM